MKTNKYAQNCSLLWLIDCRFLIAFADILAALKDQLLRRRVSDRKVASSLFDSRIGKALFLRRSTLGPTGQAVFLPSVVAISGKTPANMT